MAMRCFGRAFDLTALLASLAALGLTAGRPLAFDLTGLRAVDLADALWPAHFFFTAVCAAVLDAAFCLAIGSLPVVGREKLTQKMDFVGWAKALFAPCPPSLFLLLCSGGHASLCPPYETRHEDPAINAA